jgi:tRNA (guanine-N7-)-methyltransferase
MSVGEDLKASCCRESRMIKEAVAAQYLRRIRSFARRDSRMTAAQLQAFERLWPLYGLKVGDGKLAATEVFKRSAACFLEIGFGSGHSLIAAAQHYPEHNFIGVETFKPGIGALLLQMEALQLNNIRIYYDDAVEVIEQCIPDASLQGIHIFFPDPWPKSRHHKRRLVQAEFIKKVVNKLQKKGHLHLATDWEDYAKQMMRVLTAEEMLHNLAGQLAYAERSPFRPLVTKFEGRGENEGRSIWDLQFSKL